MLNYGLAVGTKIAGAVYNSSNKIDANLTTLRGSLIITNGDKPILSSLSTSANGPTFVSNDYFTFEADIDNGTIEYFDDPTGEYYLFQEDGRIVMKHVKSGRFQRLDIKDTPVNAGRDSYIFDELGVTVHVNSIYTHADSWPNLGLTSATRRRLAVLTSLSQAHQIYIRFQTECKIQTPFDSNILTSWIAWNDPTANPINLTPPPLNQWEPVAGDWVDVGDRLTDLGTEISTRLTDPWIWFNGDSYVPYRFAWSPWKQIEQEIRSVHIDGTSNFYANNFSFAITDSELRKRARVYANGVTLSNRQFTIANGVITVDPAKSFIGTKITVIIEPPELTPSQLAFDPDVLDEDPLVVDQFKNDSPYVYEERRGSGDSKSVKTYYFWVKNKETPGLNKKASIKQIVQLLTYFNDSYCVPQILKWANQVDARPNRYATLYIENLGHYVKAENEYKLRFKNKPHLRNDDRNIDLKNVHEEWVLIRPYQPNKIPQKLWDLVTDTVAGVNSIGENLPNPSLVLYEDRTGNVASIGPNRGQLLTETSAARDAVKYTILNTRVTKYENQILVPDPLDFVGFNVNTFATLLQDSVTARQLMVDIWRYAKPKQINEIFFALLEDGISRNLEMPDFFKTSYVALNDIRTVAIEQVSVGDNVDLVFNELPIIEPEEGDLIDEDGTWLIDESDNEYLQDDYPSV
jgi:hypothetical protein